MAIIFAWPTPNQPFGPGFGVSVGTTLPGPWPVGQTWQLDLVGAQERIIHRSTFPAPSSQMSAIYGEDFLPLAVLPYVHPSDPQGSTKTFVARLLNPQGLVDDQDSIPITLDYQSGNPYLIGQAINQISTGASGGYTDADRADAQIVKASVSTLIPASLVGGLDHLIGLVDQFQQPPRSWLVKHTPTTLTGRGVLRPARPTGVNVTYGATWSWFTIPAGFGLLEGTVDIYQQRIAQFIVEREDAGDSTYLDVMAQTSWEGDHILWASPNPTAIHYDVAPGCVVVWTWLVLPLTPQP